MAEILGLSGSLRAGPFNAGLLRAAADVAPEGTDVTNGTIRGVPLCDADVEAAPRVNPCHASVDVRENTTA